MRECGAPAGTRRQPQLSAADRVGQERQPHVQRHSTPRQLVQREQQGPGQPRWPSMGTFYFYFANLLFNTFLIQPECIKGLTFTNLTH